MTSCAADLFHLQQDGVRVAIDVNFAHFLHVAGFLAFAPKLFSAAAEIAGPAGAKGFFICLAIHPGKHQHLPAIGILSDCGNQAVRFVEVLSSVGVN